MKRSPCSDENQIYELTNQCLTGFQNLLNEGKAREGLCHAFLSKQHDSFRAWVATIGALAPSKSSLDYQLREHKHITLAVVELLLLLRDILHNEPCPTISDLSDNMGGQKLKTDPAGVLSQHGALEEALKGLHLLAPLIRRGSIPNSQFDLSARFFNPAELYDPDFINRMKHLLKDNFPTAATSLLDQLVTSMSRRRNWLLYKAQRVRVLGEYGDYTPPLTVIQHVLTPECH
ncbi:hypothetical protein TWF718_009858 [Orbilia javanica]|uniref:Uncharacterized protein n=1 Tax=Orbilia javanica TaxID=47235 RepID=A0AAN8NR62_9PEZI